MTFLKSKKRFGQFETLETKKLFAADLAASADVVSIDPGDCVSALTAGIIDPEDCPSIVDPSDCPNVIDPDDVHQLGGQEGEPVRSPYVDAGLADLGEDITGRVTENYQSVEYEDYWDMDMS